MDTCDKERSFYANEFQADYVWVLAVMVSTGIIGSTVRTVASPAMNAAGQDQDYSKNKKYQQGMREGQDDKAHNRDHFQKEAL